MFDTQDNPRRRGFINRRTFLKSAGALGVTAELPAGCRRGRPLLTLREQRAIGRACWPKEDPLPKLAATEESAFEP